MGVAPTHGRTLRASLCEIERGVFYATYPESDCNMDELVAYQVGTSADDAKRNIEASARALGYDTIIWDQAIAVPLFASHVKIVVREPAVT
jgi:hypothetical protein